MVYDFSRGHFRNLEFYLQVCDDQNFKVAFLYCFGFEAVCHFGFRE